MSQHDFNIANQGFPSTRADINSALQALGSNSSGATAPPTTYPYQFWYDETTDTLKVRDETNSTWISMGTFDQGAGVFTPNDTGIYATIDTTQTLTNKTITNIVLDGQVTEEVFAVTGTTPALDPANGTIQTWTLSGASTPTSNLVTGESLTLMIDDGAANTVTWPTIKWAGGSAPTLATTGYTGVVLMNIAGTLYGTAIGDFA